MKGSNATMYVNGVLGINFNSIALAGVTRSINYVGRSHWSNSMNVNAIYDDLKIFNKSLTQSEILMVLNSYY
jgi:hypothetical protein